MNKTQIEWALNPDGTQGYTWNPITGCLNGCEYCYARRLANTRLKERYLANEHIAGINPHESVPYIPAGLRELELTNPFFPRWWEDKLYHAWSGKPKGIFVCDMSDLFGIGIPEEWTYKVLNLCGLHNMNRYYLLTKQPQNLIKFSPFPDNAWVGLTITGKEPHGFGYSFVKVKAKMKFISFEPFLGPGVISAESYIGAGIKWVIIGALTGTKQELLSLNLAASLTLMPYGKKWTLQPKIEWVREIVEACDKASIPMFLKENLRPLLNKEAWGDTLLWGNSTGKPRQELPIER